MWTLAIPRPVPSQNAHHVNAGTSVQMAIYRRNRNAWAYDLRIAARVAGVPLVGEAQVRRRRVVITRVMGPGQRAYEPSNLIGGTKAMVDAMKPPRDGYLTEWKSGPRKGKPRYVPPVSGASLIVDDGPEFVELEYRQERGEQAGCRITVEDV